MPRASDGIALHSLVQHCAPLDQNSPYCNLLQCTFFAETSIAAEIDKELTGFISGFIVPGRPDTLFIWQVAVSERARGQGLASRMLKDLLQRPACENVLRLETTVTTSNKASWAFFERIAANLDSTIQSEILFDQEQHFAGEHESEHLLKIGPFA